MVSSTRLHYVIRFTNERSGSWFDSNLFDDWSAAVEHAKHMRDVPGFCDSFSVQSINYWLNQL